MRQAGACVRAREVRGDGTLFRLTFVHGLVPSSTYPPSGPFAASCRAKVVARPRRLPDRRGRERRAERGLESRPYTLMDCRPRTVPLIDRSAFARGRGCGEYRRGDEASLGLAHVLAAAAAVALSRMFVMELSSGELGRRVPFFRTGIVSGFRLSNVYCAK